MLQSEEFQDESNVPNILEYYIVFRYIIMKSSHSVKLWNKNRTLCLTGIADILFQLLQRVD